MADIHQFPIASGTSCSLYATFDVNQLLEFA